MRSLSILILFVSLGLLSCADTTAQQAEQPFLGRWALELPGGAGWLRVHEDHGYLDAELLWYGGSVLPVSHVYQYDDMLVVTRIQEVVREKDVRSHHITNQVAVKLENDRLVGHAVFPSHDGQGREVIAFEGSRIPDLPPAPDLSKAKYDTPITLFNGNDLTGWRLINPEHTNGFSAKEGALVNDPVQVSGQPHIHYGNLRTEQEFEDFNLKLQVNIPKGNNSGIYLRGIYEVQVFDSYGMDLDSHNMGAIYSRITPSEPAERPAGEWQDLDITLYQRHATVILNGKTIIDNQPLLGVTGGALTASEFAPGPIYLQGDHGKVSYRNIVLTPIVK